MTYTTEVTSSIIAVGNRMFLGMQDFDFAHPHRQVSVQYTCSKNYIISLVRKHYCALGYLCPFSNNDVISSVRKH